MTMMLTKSDFGIILMPPKRVGQGSMSIAVGAAIGSSPASRDNSHTTGPRPSGLLESILQG